jgi:hypothetical protein
MNHKKNLVARCARGGPGLAYDAAGNKKCGEVHGPKVGGRGRDRSTVARACAPANENGPN